MDSRAYVSALAQKDLDTKKNRKPITFDNILKNQPPNFQLQVANDQLEKLSATATFKFEIADISFAGHFVVMDKVTGSVIGSHFMGNNSVVTETTHSLIYFPHLTMRVKIASSEKTSAQAKPQLVITDDALAIAPRTKKQLQPSLTNRQNGIQQGLWHHWRSLRKQQVC